MFEKKRTIAKTAGDGDETITEIEKKTVDALSAAFDVFKRPMIVTDRDGKIIVFNKDCQCITGCYASQVVGKTFDSLPFLSSPDKPQESGRHVSNWYTIDGSIVSIRWDVSAIDLGDNKLTLHRGLSESNVSAKSKIESLQDRLNESLERYVRLTESFQNGIFIISNYRLVYVNHACETMTGFTREELLSMDPFNLLVKEDRAMAIERFRQKVEQGEAEKIEYLRINKKNGETAIWKYSLISDTINGEPSMIVTVSDITDLVNTKAKVEQTNQILETILENLHDVVFVKDREGRITFFRWSYLDEFGKNDVSHIGKTIFDLEVEPQASRIEACRIECQTTGKPCSYVKHVKEGHKTFDFRVTMSPIRDFKGEITGVIGVGRDMTEQLAVQSKAEELEKRLSVIASAITDIIFQTDGNIIKYVSPSVSLYGHDPEKLAGRSITELFGSDFLKHSIESGTHSFELETSDNGSLKHDFEIRLIKGQNGTIGVARNISERKNFEKAKRNFLRSVAHEIRNPLTLILGYSELLMSLTGDDPNLHNMVQIINDAAESEKKRLNEFFDLDKTTIEYNFEISGISNALGSLCIKLLMLISKTVRNRYNSDQANFSYTIDPALRGENMSLDFGRFSEIFENLAVNSVKYSPKDRMDIRFDATLDGKFLVIRFSDKGIGIPENELANIFKPFHQVKHGGQELEGLGLGLANVLMHVEAHGGNISVESRVDQGSTFIIKFPLFM